MDIISKINIWIQGIAANPYITVIGFVVGVAGLLYAIYIARRDRKTKILRYSLVNSILIEDGQTLYPKLEVTYDGEKLDNFVMTKVGIYNQGTDVIRMNDIAPNDPIQISVSEDFRLLEFALIKSSNPLNDFHVLKSSDHVIHIEFDYIEPYDSAIIQLLHTSKDSSSISISGTIIGASKPFVPTRFKNLKDYSNVTTPIGKTLRRLMYGLENKWFVIVSYIFFLSIFGIPSYYFLKSSNYLLGCICGLPATFSLLIIITNIFRRETLAEKGLATDALKSMLMNALSEKEDNG